MKAPGTRILAGVFKGQRLRPLPPACLVRPILARVKKSLFDILKNRIQDSIFLDLFSGSGSVGMEALSRGARKVIFVDRNPRCIALIQKNVEEFFRRKGKNQIQNQAEFHCRDVFSGFHWMGEPSDLIFSGAPYVHPVESRLWRGEAAFQRANKKHPLFLVEKLLNLLSCEKVLKETGWFIAQHHKKESFQVPEDWDCFRQERYGDSLLSFFKPC